MGVVEDKAAKKTAKSGAGLALAPGVEPPAAAANEVVATATEAQKDHERNPNIITKDEEAGVADPSLPPDAAAVAIINDVTPLEAYVPETPATLVVEGMVEPEKEKRSNGTLLLGMITLMGAIAIIVGLSVGLGEPERATVVLVAPVSDAPSASPTLAAVPTAEPTMRPTSESYVDVIEQLAFEFPDMIIEGDNQLAAQWMAEDAFFEVPMMENQTLDRFQFRQRFAMATFYYATSKAEGGWIDDCNFLSSEHICNWTCPFPDIVSSFDDALVSYGVRTQFPMGTMCFAEIAVFGMQIVENGLSGTIPTELGALNFPGLEPLLWVALTGNALSGTIPFEAFRVFDLDQFGLIALFLGRNQLTGSIPAHVPTEILPKISNLFLPSNQLSGPLPSTMPDMVGLLALYLENNLFSGSLEESRVLEMASCGAIWLEGNQLTGTIPEIVLEPNTTSPLRQLFLDRNLLTGSIPTSVVELEQLDYLSLADNMITGSLPPDIGSLSNLERINLRENALTSSLPLSLRSLSNMVLFDVDDNQLTGNPLQDEIFHNMSDLLALRLEINKFRGPITVSEGWTSLLTLILSVNEFTGTIPTEIGLLSTLGYLTLGINDITGPVPTEIAQLTNLEGLWINGNNVTGSLDGLCDSRVVPFQQGYIADCLEEGGVQCSCCTVCCDKALVGGTVDYDEGERRDDYCRAV